MAKKKDESWVKIYRSLMDNPVWTEEPFTLGQAWVDLIMMVSFKETDNIHNGRLRRISRGSIFTSIEYLSKRWHRSRKWVRGRLNMLKTLKMVTTQVTTQGTLITIEKYASFQGEGPTQGTTEGTTVVPTQGTHNKNNKECIKEIADGIAGNKGDSGLPPPGERYVMVHNYATGKDLIWDNQEERYVDG